MVEQSQPVAGSETPLEPVAVWDGQEQAVVWVSLRRAVELHYSNRCPECESRNSPAMIQRLERPEEYAAELNEILRCGYCHLIWSPKPAETTVIRRADVDLPQEGLEVPVQIQRVIVPYPFRDYICPYCEQPITTHQQRRAAKPASHAHELNDVLRCPHCMKYFSPKTREATVIRS